MSTLNQQVRDSIRIFNQLFLKNIAKYKGPEFAKYLESAIKGRTLDKMDFENVGELVYYLQIEKLEAANKASPNKKITDLIARLKSDNEEGLFDYIGYIEQNPEMKEVVSNAFDPKITPLLSDVMDQYAKVQDISRRLKAVIYSQYNQIQYNGKIADDLGYVFSRLAHDELSEERVEEIQRISDSVKFTPSLTAHPTNPECVPYVGKAMSFMKSFLSANADQAEIEEALRVLIEQSISSPSKKTQQTEIQEALFYLNSIYDSLDSEYAQLESIISQSPVQIKLADDINQIKVWVAGDGDGNTNATRESLADNIEMFRAAIKRRYLVEMRNLGLLGTYNVDKCDNPALFISFLEEQSKKHGADVKAINSLIRKVKTFGYHFAQIDIRHTAVDLSKIDTTLKSLEANEDVKALLAAKYPDDFALRSLRELMVKEIVHGQRVELEGLGSVPKFLADFNPGQDNDSMMISRILGRFELAADHPKMFEKAIVAEFNDPEQIKAVMNILRDTGHRVGVPGASLNIVPLAESKANLEKLHTDIETALSDPEYFEHIKRTKRVYFMIARSDTVRRNGVGAQFSQEMAIKKSIRSILLRLASDPSITTEDLQNFEIIPYSGGGAALQRGGGKMTEIASVYGRYALEALKSLQQEISEKREVEEGEVQRLLERIKVIKIKEPCLTTQGHQNALLYQNGGHTLASFYSQGLYAQAKIKGLIPDNQRDMESLRNHCYGLAAAKLGVEISEIEEMEIGALGLKLDKIGAKDLKNKIASFKLAPDLYSAAATMDKFSADLNIGEFLNDISNRAVAVYARDVGSEESQSASPIDKLLSNGPWLLTKRGNKSSRSSKRGVADYSGDIETVEDFLGIKGKDKSKALAVLKQRAIGVESLSSHSGTNVVAWLGWREAIESYAKDHPDFDFAEMFHSSKSFRDIIRSADLSIQSSDFQKSWVMLCGKNQPSDEELESGHESYLAKILSVPSRQGDISNEETLAYIQVEARRTADLFLKIAGKEPSPEAKLENRFNHESAITASKMEIAITKLANLHPEAKVTAPFSSLCDYTYVAADTSLGKPAHLMEPQRRRKKGNEVEIPAAKVLSSRFAQRSVDYVQAADFVGKPAKAVTPKSNLGIAVEGFEKGK